ncbi:hypothetical protein KCU93_g5575, partial [Aureobasidium melanogenum]
MAWTQDELHSLEQLLKSKLRDKSTRPNEMDQAQKGRHSTKQEELEQGRVPVLEPSLYNALREPERQAEPQTCKWGVTLLIYVFAFCLMYFPPRKVSAAAPIARKPPAMITEYRIEVNQPGNYTMSVPSMWSVASTPVASTSMATKTITVTVTEKITKTVTATATERTTAVATESREPQWHDHSYYTSLFRYLYDIQEMEARKTRPTA